MAKTVVANSLYMFMKNMKEQMKASHSESGRVKTSYVKLNMFGHNHKFVRIDNTYTAASCSVRLGEIDIHTPHSISVKISVSIGRRGVPIKA